MEWTTRDEQIIINRQTDDLDVSVRLMSQYPSMMTVNHPD